MSGIQEFQKFMVNDPQLKAFGNCVKQVNLFALESEERSKQPGFYNQRPNRVALVVDAESCLDRLYGGYFPDWTCGGQWQNMMAFLSTLITNCHHANVHLAIFFNGANEPTRFSDWVKIQLKNKQNANQVIKHLTKRMTPPPKAFWVPPCSVRNLLKLALIQLHVPVYNSLEDHHQEIMSFCWENGYHGVLSEDGEFSLYNPPKYFSAHDLKLSYQHELMTTEFVIDEVAKSLDLNPNRFNLLAALLGCHILPADELTDFHNTLVPEMKQASEGKYKVGFERVIRAVVNYVRALPSVEDYEAIAKDVFGNPTDPKVKKLKEAVKYFYKGTKEGHVKTAFPKKAKNIKSEQEPSQEKSKKEETDLVERIALDLDQLDLDETVEKVSKEIGIVQALASGAEVAPSEDGKYPHEKQSAKPINIPKPHFEVKKTALERSRLARMSPYIYQLLTKGEIKLPAVVESDILPQIHRFYQPLRAKIYAILFNLYHVRFDRRQLEEKLKGQRRKAEELRKNAKKETDEAKAEEMKSEAKELMEIKLPELVNYTVREWLPYDNYEQPETVEAVEINWPSPTIQRLWFGNVQEDKQKRIQAFLSCMHSDDLPHGNIPSPLLLMACVLRYMLVNGKNESVLRKPELDAFLATAMSPELRDVGFLAEMRLEMVTVRGVHLASLFMQGIEMAFLANDACGSPIPVQMCLPWTYFDGKLFHSKLIKATQARNLVELCDGRVQMAYQVERIRDMIMTGQALPMGNPNRRMQQKYNKPFQQQKQKSKGKKIEPKTNEVKEENDDNEPDVVIQESI